MGGDVGNNGGGGGNSSVWASNNRRRQEVCGTGRMAGRLQLGYGSRW